jgi:hypothetical protein
MIRVKEVECYKTADGRIFEDEDKAKAHAMDLVGMELDGLFLLSGLDITRSQQYKAQLTLLGKEKETAEIINRLHALINY